MKRKLVITICLAAFAFVAKAQPTIQWQKNYGGNNTDRAMSVKVTTDGGYIVAGYTLSNNGNVVGHKGGEDFWILKLNSSGIITWKKIYGGSNDDRAYAVQQTADGGYIVAGTTNSDNGNVTNHKGGFDMWVIKLNSSGALTWQKTLGGSDDEVAFSIDQLASGSYVVAGESKSETNDVGDNNGGYDWWVVKLSPTGGILWETNLGGSSDESAKSVQECSDGSIIVAGETTSNDQDVSGNKGGYDFWVVRLKANGTVKWKKTYGGTSQDNAYAVEQLSNGNFIVVGETESNNNDIPNNSGGDDFWVLRLRGDGTIFWSKTFGGETVDRARYVSETTDGAVIIVGETESNSGDVTVNHGGSDFWVIKVAKSTGNLLWQKSLGGSDNDNGSAIDVTAAGGVIVAGESESDDGNLNNNKGNDDYWIVKLMSGSPKLIVGDELAAESLTIYPNPATEFINVCVDGDAQLIELLDMQGRLIKSEVVIGNVVLFTVKDIPAGQYVIRVTGKDMEAVNKIILKQ